MQRPFWGTEVFQQLPEWRESHGGHFDPITLSRLNRNNGCSCQRAGDYIHGGAPLAVENQLFLTHRCQYLDHHWIPLRSENGWEWPVFRWISWGSGNKLPAPRSHSSYRTQAWTRISCFLKEKVLCSLTYNLDVKMFCFLRALEFSSACVS